MRRIKIPVPLAFTVLLPIFMLAEVCWHDAVFCPGGFDGDSVFEDFYVSGGDNVIVDLHAGYH